MVTNLAPRVLGSIRDLKSLGTDSHAGSIPAPSTLFEKDLALSPVALDSIAIRNLCPEL